MKEIGEEFQEKREEIGISIDEVSNDLDIDSLLLENLESGNQKVFKDVIELKEVVSSYAKYLGLDDEKILGDLNDFLFEKTSKISLDDIKERLEKTEQEEKKIRTPYTIDREKSKSIILVVILFLVLVILVIFYVLLKKLFL